VAPRVLGTDEAEAGWQKAGGPAIAGRPAGTRQAAGSTKSAGRPGPATTSTAGDWLRRLRALANPEHARVAQWFFKTGPGEYGEGDRFLGIRVPVLRRLIREAAALPLAEVRKLLSSPWHEARLLAALILVRRYERGDEAERQALYRLYLDSMPHLNNWDIIDTSAPHIVGRHLDGRGRATLVRLARSKNLWSRRIAVLATFWSIRHGQFDDTLTLAAMLLDDREDLMHKAVGWMLREVGNRDVEVLREFLQAHASRMPRTMLRYAIEKLPVAERQAWMAVRRETASS
jgi:3-methyladenine DNA glycosylase AlkD